MQKEMIDAQERYKGLQEEQTRVLSKMAVVFGTYSPKQQRPMSKSYEFLPADVDNYSNIPSSTIQLQNDEEIGQNHF